MKFLKSAALVAALFLALAGSAMADSTCSAIAVRNYKVSREVQTSATAPCVVASVRPAMTDTVYLSANTAMNAYVDSTLQDGTLLTSRTIGVGRSIVSKTYPSPQSHQKLITIPVAASMTSTNALPAVVIESR